MKKLGVLVLFVIGLLTLSACNSEDNIETNDTNNKVVLMTNHEITDYIADFTFSIRNIENATLVLSNGSTIVHNIEVTSGDNQVFTFSNLDQNTAYDLTISTDQTVYYETTFVTGFWTYEIGQAAISSVEAINNSVVVGLNIIDEDHTFNQLSLQLIADMNIVDVISVTSDDSEVIFDNLLPDTVYSIRLIASTFNGLETINNVLLSSDQFSTVGYENEPTITNISFPANAEANEPVTGTIQFDNPENYEIKEIKVNGHTYKEFNTVSATEIEVTIPAEYKVEVNSFIFDNHFFDETITSYGIDFPSAYIHINLLQDGEINLIHNLTELNAINQDLSASYRLEADITMPSNQRFTPIGSDAKEDFTGSFDGNSHTISNIRFEENLHKVGLFATANDAYFGHLNISLYKEELSIDGPNVYVGGLVGDNKDGIITNVSVEGELQVLIYRHDYAMNYYTGGLVGRQFGGTLTDVHTEAWIYAFSGNSQNTGGIVGFAEDVTIIRPTAVVENELVYTSPYFYAGGVAGVIQASEGNSSSITDANVTFTRVNFKQGFYLGGVAGASKAHVTISGSTVELNDFLQVENNGVYYIGGISGYNEGVITDSVVDINAESEYLYIRSLILGGIAATNQTSLDIVDAPTATITNSYATVSASDATSDSMVIGGIAGYNIEGVISGGYSSVTTSGAFNNIYAAGAVVSNSGTNAVVENIESSFHSKQTTSLYTYVGAGVVGVNNEGATVRNTIGTVDNALVTVYVASSTYYVQYVIIGGVVGDNSGFTYNSVAKSVTASVSNPRITYIGGIAADNVSHNVETTASNDGGGLFNNVLLSLDITLNLQASSETYYGLITGLNEVAQNAEIGGYQDNYYLDTVTGFDLINDFEVVDPAFELEEETLGTSYSEAQFADVYALNLNTGFYDTSALIPELNIVDTLRKEA